jgi:hypothetical protein
MWNCQDNYAGKRLFLEEEGEVGREGRRRKRREKEEEKGEERSGLKEECS